MKRTQTALALLLFFAACHSPASRSGIAPVLVIHTGGPYDSLHVEMDTVLCAYYRLKDEMVLRDTLQGDSAAYRLSSLAGNLGLTRIRGSGKYDQVRSMAASLQGEIDGFEGEDSRGGKLEEFQMISDITYDMVRTIGLQSLTVYREYCPMAFHNRGAYWLSDRQKIENPYFGDLMPDCGEVRETMKY